MSLDLAHLDRQGVSPMEAQNARFQSGPWAQGVGCILESRGTGLFLRGSGCCWGGPCAEACNLIKPLEPLPQARAARAAKSFN